MFCKNCGSELVNGVCPKCGDNNATAGQPTTAPTKKPRICCLPSFIIGLIGALFGMMGGICTTMCSFGYGSTSAFLLIFGGSLVGALGSCFCFSKAKIGSILMIIGALMIVYRAYFMGGADFFSIIAWLFLLAGGIIGLIYSFVIRRNQ